LKLIEDCCRSATIEEVEMKRIDMHHHIVPEQYVKGLARIGITESYGQPIPDWSPKKSLSFMDKVGADVAVMSISTPGVSFADEQL
jgi:hypothetical protein